MSYDLFSSKPLPQYHNISVYSLQFITFFAFFYMSLFLKNGAFSTIDSASPPSNGGLKPYFLLNILIPKQLRYLFFCQAIFQ